MGIVEAPNYFHTPFPTQVIVETTAACNQRCIFCGRTYMERPKKTMSREIFEKIVDEIARENPATELWPTFMGEAMLLGDKLFDMIRYARDAGCEKITINTNGTRLNEKTIPRILASGIDRLIVSCDAHTPETHAVVRPAVSSSAGGGGLTGIYRGIHLLLDTMRAKSLIWPLVELQFSIFDQNEHEVEAFRQYWLDNGVVTKVRPKLYWSGNVAGGEHRMHRPDRQPCLWVLDTAGIHWNGNVVMCAVDCDGKYVAGNIEMQSLKQIWNGPLKWMRELHMRRRFSELPEVCRACPDWEVKRARTYFPTQESKQIYETYIQRGRTFTSRHFWDPETSPIK